MSKYLERYADPEWRDVWSSGAAFGHVVVVPAYGEGAGTLDAMASIPRGERAGVLVILVINARQSSPRWVHEENEALRRAIDERYGGGDVIGPTVTRYGIPQGALWVVDRGGPVQWLPEKQGVGIARKIGADLALAAVAAGWVDARWIHCTDADAQVPVDYFTSIRDPSLLECSAVSYPFEHYHPDTELDRAACEYEVGLRHYTLGLAYAGSPYAFDAVGSTLAIDAEAYAAVRGFPARMAGEDFHLLNKLAKVAPMGRVTSSPIRLLGRTSERVPFGTGRALGHWQKTREPIVGYDPRVFDALKVWLEWLQHCAATPEQARDFDAWSSERVDSVRAGVLRQWARDHEVESHVDHLCGMSPDYASRLRHLHTWFDALKTLKLIHFLRDRAWPSLPIEQAVKRAPWLDLGATATLDDIRRRLGAR